MPQVEGVSEYGAVWPAIWRRAGGAKWGHRGSRCRAGLGWYKNGAGFCRNQTGTPSQQQPGQVHDQHSPPLVTARVLPPTEPGPGLPGAAPLIVAPAGACELDGQRHLQQRWQQAPSQGIYTQEGNPGSGQDCDATPAPDGAGAVVLQEPTRPCGGLRAGFRAVWTR